MKKQLTAAALAAALALNLAACGSTAAGTDNAASAAAGEAASAEFTPALDTNLSATLDIAGFMGNYEALDQVMNAFNEIYPNVVFTYDHNSIHLLSEYVQNNANVDIFMTAESNLTRDDIPEDYVADHCLDLTEAGLSFDAVQEDALAACTVDGKLLRLPVAMNPRGIVVNKTLLEKEGLSVPTNYQEFLAALETLQAKGYTPLQGSEQHIYSELMYNMGVDTIMADDSLTAALQKGDASAVTAMLPVFERLESVLPYTDYDLNSTFGADNYDSTIMAFFEGNMPFYVCTSECFSGMKKRESKSETYSADPFEYEFIYAPMGDEGVYAYTEPWYGFSINKDSEDKDLAVEFLRFMATDEQIEKMASIKGMPAVNKNAADERYPALKNPAAVQADYADNGTVSGVIRGNLNTVYNRFGAGEYASAQEAAEAFVAMCAE